MHGSPFQVRPLVLGAEVAEAEARVSGAVRLRVCKMPAPAAAAAEASATRRCMSLPVLRLCCLHQFWAARRSGRVDSLSAVCRAKGRSAASTGARFAPPFARSHTACCVPLVSLRLAPRGRLRLPSGGGDSMPPLQHSAERTRASCTQSRRQLLPLGCQRRRLLRSCSGCNRAEWTQET